MEFYKFDVAILKILPKKFLLNSFSSTVLNLDILCYFYYHGIIPPKSNISYRCSSFLLYKLCYYAFKSYWIIIQSFILINKFSSYISCHSAAATFVTALLQDCCSTVTILFLCVFELRIQCCNISVSIMPNGAQLYQMAPKCVIYIEAEL